MASGLITRFLGEGTTAARPADPDIGDAIGFYWSTDDDELSMWREGAWAEDVLAGGAIALDSLSDVDAPSPSDGDVLTWNDADNEWQAAASGGGGGVVGSDTFTGVPTVDVALPSGYDNYQVVLTIAPAGDGVNLQAKLTSDNFATVIEGASDYCWIDRRSGSGGQATSFDNSDSLMQFATLIGNASGEHCTLILDVVNAPDSGWATDLIGRTIRRNASGEISSDEATGRLFATTVCNGIRFFLSDAGNGSGKYSVRAW